MIRIGLLCLALLLGGCMTTEGASELTEPVESAWTRSAKAPIEVRFHGTIESVNRGSVLHVVHTRYPILELEVRTVSPAPLETSTAFRREDPPSGDSARAFTAAARKMLADTSFQWVADGRFGVVTYRSDPSRRVGLIALPAGSGKKFLSGSIGAEADPYYKPIRCDVWHGFAQSEPYCRLLDEVEQAARAASGAAVVIAFLYYPPKGVGDGSADIAVFVEASPGRPIDGARLEEALRVPPQNANKRWVFVRSGLPRSPTSTDLWNLMEEALQRSRPMIP